MEGRSLSKDTRPCGTDSRPRESSDGPRRALRKLPGLPVGVACNRGLAGGVGSGDEELEPS
jgi:hypothetical protein